MRLQAPISEGGVMTSRAVTTLALDARRVLSGPANGVTAEEILRRIDGLKDELGEAPAAPLQAWLTNLRRKVEHA